MAEVQRMTWMTSTWTPLYGYIHERHASSSSSSWSSLYGEFTIYQESTPEVCKTVIPSDWKVDQGSARWPRLITKSLRGDQRVYYVTKLLRLRMPKTCVFADSVLCLGSMRDRPVEAWRNKIQCYLDNRYLKDLNRIDGEPMEPGWSNFPGFTALGILEEKQTFMTEVQCEPEQFKDRIIFMSMYNDIVWGERGNTVKIYLRIMLRLRIMLADSCSDVGHVWCLDQRRIGTELTLINQMETGIRLLN